MNGFFRCPVCGLPLTEEEKLYKCEKGHSFDKSKFGYVNLLMSQSSSAKRHGDDRTMVRARRDFLSKDYYAFLADCICENMKELLPENPTVLDAGCGECWYSCRLQSHFAAEGRGMSLFGVDISKDALEFASKRGSGIKTAVASVFDIPAFDESCDGVMNVFAPDAFAEFSRVLKPGGHLIQVIPLEKHLFELKAAIYEKPYLNDVPSPGAEGFELVNEIRLGEDIELKSSEDIMALFRMTPYYYKTGRDDQKKLEAFESFRTRAEFSVRIYRKEN